MLRAIYYQNALGAPVHLPYLALRKIHNQLEGCMILYAFLFTVSLQSSMTTSNILFYRPLP